MKLDVMPTDETILGFSNRWYKPAIEAAAVVALDGFELRVVTTPYFIGTKLEAFRGRGKEDFYASSDLEDIITVLDGRPTVVEEVADSPSETPPLHRQRSRQDARQPRIRERTARTPSWRRNQPSSSSAGLPTLNSLRGLGSMRSAPRQKRTNGPKSRKNPTR